MTSMSSTIENIRRILDDSPDTTTAAVINTTNGTAVVVADIDKFAVGNMWEFDDDTGEQVYIAAVDASTATITMRRGYHGSTPATHLASAVMLKAPIFTYDRAAMAVQEVLDADLYKEGIYTITDHTQAPSQTTDVFDAPTADCEKLLRVYFQLTADSDPSDLWRFKQEVSLIDTDLYATGKYIIIHDQPDAAVILNGLMYLQCAHKVEISTMSASQERIIDLLAAAKLMEWAEVRRVQGPTNQGDQSVRPGQGNQTAAYYRSVAEELMAKEKAYLIQQTPRRRTYVR